jgi:L-asparaginase
MAAAGFGFPEDGVDAGRAEQVAAAAALLNRAKIPLVLASRAMTGPVFVRTYGYPGSEIDLLAGNILPAGCLSGLKARLLLGLCSHRKGH